MVSMWIAFLLFYIQDLVSAFSDDVCYSDRKGKSEGCQFGCCGKSNDKECCDPLGMMVGISIGGIVVLASIVAIVVCCVKQHTRNKRRLQPRQNPPVMVMEAKGPPAYPGLPYDGCNTIYNDSYKGPIVNPPTNYAIPPGYPPPSYSAPDPKSLYPEQLDKQPTSPPPPYPTT